MTATTERSIAAERHQTPERCLNRARRFAPDRIVALLPLAFLLAATQAQQRLRFPDDSFITPVVYPAILRYATYAYVALWLVSWVWPTLRRALRLRAAQICAAVLLLGVWDAVTDHYRLVPMPYFPGPDRVLGALVTDRAMLWASTKASLQLLTIGFALGGTAGLFTGLAIGSSKKLSFWAMPAIKAIGPVPASAWLPVAMVAFHTSFEGSIFLLFLSAWFPITIMTASGIANVPKSYFEVARTLGARPSFLLFRVAVPAALPSIFTGAFMSLGAVFGTLIIAEMMGVKEGLGWYISWAQGWAEYGKLYGALIVISVLFSSVIGLLFLVRDRVLIWQKGVIRW